jgi:hypothetical protein
LTVSGGGGAQIATRTMTTMPSSITTDDDDNAFKGKPKKVILSCLVSGGSYCETEVYDESVSTTTTRLIYNGASSPTTRTIGQSNSFIQKLEDSGTYGVWFNTSNTSYFSCAIIY